MIRSLRRCSAALAGCGCPSRARCCGTQLTGAGSKFVFPFFSKAFYTYSQKNPDVTVNYQSIGSGGGIKQFARRPLISGRPTFR